VRADNTAHIVQAARDRHTEALGRAQEALRRLDRAGTPITFPAVAVAASVSRAWLYREPSLRAEIQRLRAQRVSGQAAALPSAQRATSESLQRRLEAALEHVTSLREENHRLREQIARLHGERRAATQAPSTRPSS
jgi:hypothetical protein